MRSPAVSYCTTKYPAPRSGAAAFTTPACHVLLVRVRARVRARARARVRVRVRVSRPPLPVDLHALADPGRPRWWSRLWARRRRACRRRARGDHSAVGPAEAAPDL